MPLVLWVILWKKEISLTVEFALLDCNLKAKLISQVDVSVL